MAEIELRAEHLVLDNDNPRITHSTSQQQTLQKVVRDQKMKLVRLAASIVEHGLSPIERLMVLEVSSSPKRFIALEGNRRVAALRLLSNPAAMTGLEMPVGVRKALERLASVYDPSSVEPIRCFEVKSRDEGRYWIELRHNGEDEGRGIVNWKPIVAARFRNKEPAIQALDMVLEHGGFNEDEADEIRSNFSLTTLRRLIESADVRGLIGLDLKNGQLTTTLSGSEIIKPLKRIVKDIATKEVDSRSFNKKEQMIKYVQEFKGPDKPDLKSRVAERPVEGISKGEFVASPKPKLSRRQPTISERKQVVPKQCHLNVTENRISEIFLELRRLRIDDARNAIAVLLRVFLELSVDHHLEANGVSLSDPKPGGGERGVHPV